MGKMLLKSFNMLSGRLISLPGRCIGHFVTLDINGPRTCLPVETPFVSYWTLVSVHCRKRYGLCAIVCAGGAYGVYRVVRIVAPYAWRWLCFGVRALYDRITSLVVTRVNERRRLLFNTRLVLKEAAVSSGHSHGDAAAIRTGSSWAIDDYVLSTGCRTYTVSYGPRDDGVGQRLYYHPRDYILPAKDEPMVDGDIIKMIDVDYYADMPYWLSFGKPIVVYTFVPTTAGGKVVDGTFRIHNNEVFMDVNGGGRYQHQLWDYAYDYVTVDTLAGVWIVGIDQKRTSRDPARRVIQLTPQAWVPFPFSLTVARNPLKRLKMTHGQFSTIVYQDQAEQYVSVAKNGSAYSVTVKGKVFEAIRIRHEYSKSNKNISDVESYLRKEPELEATSHLDAALLYDLLETKIVPELRPSIVGCGETPAHYQTMVPLVTENGKTYARTIGPNVMVTAAFPAISLNNDVACIAGRV